MKPLGVRIVFLPCLILAILSGCSQGEKPTAEAKSTTIPERSVPTSRESSAAEGLVLSPNDKLASRTPREAPAQAKPHIYNRVVALCIGINKYRHNGIISLNYAEPDATGFAQVVRSRYGYETVMLLGKDATRGAIGAKLRGYAEQLGEKDVLIIFFAGHGQVIELPSHGQAGFLIPYDANLDLDDRSNPDTWSGQALDMRRLVESIGSMKAHHVVLIADACSSGFMTGRGNFAERPDLQVLLTEPSRMVMAAATERQKAREDATTGHGLFTMALLEALNSPDAASVTDIFNEVRKRVVKNSMLRDQLPQMGRLGEGDGEFVFIPLAIPKEEVQLAFQGRAEHALSAVYARSLARVAQRTQLGDVFEAFEANDYRFSMKPHQGEKVWQEKVERFQKNAQIGDALAMAGLHYCYSRGLGVEKDEKQAIRWARLAYDTDQPVGKHLLGRCLLNGIGVEKNEEAGWRLIHEASEGGFAISQLSIVSRVGEDQNLDPKDRIAKASDLYEKSAKAGLATAMFRLANRYAGTIPGTTRDMDKGLKLLNAASDKGLSIAKWMLFDVYSSGVPDVPKNLEKARDLLIRAAEDGFAPAQYSLACEYYQKRGVPFRLNLAQNTREAAKWADLAARQTELSSIMLISTMYEFGDGIQIDSAKAREWCEKAAALNYAPALVQQGVWCSDGTIYEQNDKRAFSLFQQAARKNYPNGCWMLGRMYEQARGMQLGGHSQMEMKPYLRHHAIHWYIQAVRLGNHPKAREKLEDRSFISIENFNSLREQYPESAKEFEQLFGPRF